MPRDSHLDPDVPVFEHPAPDLIRAWFPFAHVDVVVAALVDC